MDLDAINQLNARLTAMSPPDVLLAAWDLFGASAAISFSGAEDVALIAMAHEAGLPLPIFTLDTGRLHPETYRFLEQVRERYGVQLQVFSPDPAAVESLVREKGLFSFYKDGHGECCEARKVQPLRRALANRRAWISGQRRDQSLETRAGLAIVQLDRAFSTPEQPLVKFNPLAAWNAQKVWSYLRAVDAPYNALHERGFHSIGCEPCTRAVLPGQHEREGRWWWEASAKKECGLHSGTAPDPSSHDGEQSAARRAKDPA